MTVDFAFSEEQEQLRGTVRKFLADRYDDAGLAAVADSGSGVDEEVWPLLVEMGWLDDQLDFTDQAVLFEESGYRLLPAPLFCTLALTRPITEAETSESAAAEPVPGSATPATLAWAEPGRGQRLADVDGLTTTYADGVLTGRKVLVPDAAAARICHVVAAGPDGPGIYRIETAKAQVTPHETMDGTRRLGTVELTGTPAAPVLTGQPFEHVLGRLRARALAAAALEAVGVAQRALDLLVEHARTRRQFGRQIGVYQAVSHKASDIYLRLQQARSLAYWAAWCVAADDEMAPMACLAAKSHAAPAAVLACEQSIQGHGGTGFTWEHVLHRYYKRALWLAAFDGTDRTHRAELAAFLLD